MSIWVDATTSAGSAILGAGGIGAVVSKVIKGVAKEAVNAGTQDIRDDIKEVKNDVSALSVKFAAETGGNSGGLRQAINEQAAHMASIGEDVAELKGAVGVLKDVQRP
jgi:hypothetical protein